MKKRSIKFVAYSMINDVWRSLFRDSVWHILVLGSQEGVLGINFLNTLR